MRNVFIKINIVIIVCLILTVFISLMELIFKNNIYNYVISYYEINPSNSLYSFLTLVSINSNTISIAALIFSFGFSSQIAKDYAIYLYSKNSKSIDIATMTEIEKHKSFKIYHFAALLFIIFSFMLEPISLYGINTNSDIIFELIKYFFTLNLRFILLIHIILPHHLRSIRIPHHLRSKRIPHHRRSKKRSSL